MSSPDGWGMAGDEMKGRELGSRQRLHLIWIEWSWWGVKWLVSGKSVKNVRFLMTKFTNEPLPHHKDETILVINYSRIFQLFSVSPLLRHYIEKKNQQLKNFVWFQGVLCLLPITNTKMEKSKKSFMKLLKNFSQYRRAVFIKRKKVSRKVCGNWILVEFV